MPHERIEADPAENGMTAWDYGAIIALATVGFTLSYDALRQVAVAIHVRPALSYLFPVAIDGFIAYGVRAIVLLRNRPFGARLYAWFLFLAATAASLWANALHAITLNHGPQAGRSALHLGDSVVGVLSTLAPLALAGSVHLYILMARTAESSVPDRSAGGPGPVRQDVQAGVADSALAQCGGFPGGVEQARELDTVPGPSAPDGRETRTVEQRVPVLFKVSAAAAAHPGDAENGPSAGRAHVDGAPDGQNGPLGPGDEIPSDRGHAPSGDATGQPRAPETVRSQPDREEVPVPDGVDPHQDREADDEWLEELLPIARVASERAGRISRDAIKDAVRAHQPIGNDRLSELLARLKEEEQAAKEPTPATASSALW